MDEAVKQRKIKARLRGETCESCKHTVNFPHLRSYMRLSKSKPRLYCERHKHNKKYDSWCRFYEQGNSFDPLA